MIDYGEIHYSDLFEGTIETVSVNRLVSVYLMTSFAYYIFGSSLITDAEFDRLCKRLLDEYSDVTHQHKKYLDLNSLRAGTAFQLKFKDYPSVVRAASIDWMEDARSFLLGRGFSSVKVVANNTSELSTAVNLMGLKDHSIVDVKNFHDASVVGTVEYIK